MELKQLLTKAFECGGSDVFIVPGAQVCCKVKGDMVALTENKMLPADTEQLVREAYELAGRKIEALEENGDDDFSFSLRSVSRFRCNAYFQRGTMAATCRVVAFGLPDPKKLNIPDMVIELAQYRNGMILVTGPAGSGKSTTLACMVDRILDTFPAEQQAQVRVQISMVLRAVVSQRLVPKKDGGQAAVFEVMTVNPAVQNMIRDGRTHQIDNVIFGGGNQGMMSMDNELQKLYRASGRHHPRDRAALRGERRNPGQAAVTGAQKMLSPRGGRRPRGVFLCVGRDRQPWHHML